MSTDHDIMARLAMEHVRYTHMGLRPPSAPEPEPDPHLSLLHDLVRVVEQLEWSMDGGWCPKCGMHKEDGHIDNICHIALILAKAKAAGVGGT